MKKNTFLSDLLVHFAGLILARCRTILHFSKWWFAAGFFSALTSCSPTTNNYNEHKYLQTNVDSETRGKGGGTGDGGGGQGILCSNDVNDPRLKGKLLVRDIYEAITNYGRTMKPVNGENIENSNQIDPQALKLLVSSLKHYFGPASQNLDFTKEQYWLDFEKSISFINDETSLNHSQDANSPLSLPKGCEIVQIAFWHESSGPIDDGKLYVDQKLWRNLDNFNKVALLAHEFFFKQARQVGYKNSDYIRNKIGQLLSTEGITPIFQQWVPSSDKRLSDILPASMQGFKYCTGTSTEDPSAELQLYQYKGQDNLQHFVIPLLKSKSVSISLLQGVEFNFNSNENYALAKATDLWLFGTDNLCTNCLNSVELFNGERDLMARQLWYDYELLTPVIARYDEPWAFVYLKKNQSLWSSQVNSNAQVTQFSLLNPGFNFNGPIDIKLKPPSEIINNIYTKITSDFENLGMELATRNGVGYNEQHAIPDFEKYTQYIQQNKKNITLAISILDNEIKKAISDATYPDAYIKWTEALNKVWEFLRVDPIKDSNLIFNVIPSKILNVDIPKLLYKIKINAHNQSDFAYIPINQKAYILESPTYLSIDPGKVQVQQANSTVSFNLLCKDYKSIFSTAIKENPNSNMNQSLRQDVEIISEQDDDTTRIKDLLTKVASTKSIKGTENFIANIFENRLPVNPREPDNFCQQKNRFFGFNCRDFISLSNDLNLERKISVKPCAPNTAQSLTIEKLYKLQCKILELESLKISYQIVFAVDPLNSAGQKFHFVRQLPYEVKDLESTQQNLSSGKK